MEERQQLMADIIEAFKRHRFKREDAQQYLDWIKLYLNHNRALPIASLDTDTAKEFLRFLSEEKGLMPSRQKQAYLALNFFYNQVLRRSLWQGVNFGEQQELPDEIEELSPAFREHDPETPEWTKYLQEPYRLIGQIAFHYGLQLEEVLNLRIGDIELDKQQIKIRDAFGDTTEIEITDRLFQPLALQVKKAHNLNQQDTRLNNVYFRSPDPLRRKQLTNNPRWYFLFPGTLQFNLHTQKRVRESINPTHVEKAFEQAQEYKSSQVTSLISRAANKAASL